MSEVDYLDRLGNLLPWQVTLSENDRIIIILIASCFVSFIGFTLLCLVCPQCPLRRHCAKRKSRHKEQFILSLPPNTSVLLPPKYESILVDDYAIQKLSTSKYLELGRKQSCMTSDSDGKCSSTNDHDANIFRFDSHRSSVSLPNLYSPPYAQVQLRYYYDLEKNVFNVHLSNCEHFPCHPAFGEQGDYFIKIQLLTNKLLKKLKDAYKKRRLSLHSSSKRSQQLEQTTKHLSRTMKNIISCNEQLQFIFDSTNGNNNVINTVINSSMRILLYCCDRYGIQDLMFEQWIYLHNLTIKSLCKPNEQVQQVEFKQTPKASVILY
ncbi:unnamed protein product, partial [Didymodactylos carnosus]